MGHWVGTRKLVAWALTLACLGYAVVRVLGLERGFPLVPLIAGLVALALAGLVAPRALGGPSPTA